MHVRFDPQAPIYVLANNDGETEIFQLPYRFTYADSDGQEVVATVNDVEELILFLDERSSHHLRSTLAEIDAHQGTVQRILPRF